MAAKEISLPDGKWTYDSEKPLGLAGGFGQVFVGIGADGEPVAVKRLKIEAKQAGHRELRIALDLKGRELQHVMPVLDSGEDAASKAYFVVMPRAEKSLQDRIDEGKTLDAREAIEVLLQIVEGLNEVSDIVHRDLKPANVLFHDGVWKVADFGIARFVADTTSARTLKGC